MREYLKNCDSKLKNCGDFFIMIIIILLEEVSPWSYVYTSDSRTFWSLCKPFPRGSTKFIFMWKSNIKMLLFDLDLPTRFWVNILVSYFLGHYPCCELEILISNPLSRVKFIDWLVFLYRWPRRLSSSTEGRFY